MEKRRNRARLLVILGLLSFLVLASLLALFSGVFYDLFLYDGSEGVPKVAIGLEKLVLKEDGSYEIHLDVDFRSTRKLEGLSVTNIRLYTDPEEKRKDSKPAKWMYRARVVSPVPTGPVPQKFQVVLLTDPLDSEWPTFDLLLDFMASARLGGIFKGGISYGAGASIHVNRGDARKESGERSGK